MNTAIPNLLEFTDRFPDEKACIAYLENARWHGHVVSPYSGGEVYRLTSRMIYKCKDTGRQFSVRTGTIFEESRLPLRKWFMAIFLLNSLKKGVSSIQLGKFLGITQKSAWFVLQRLRYAVEHKNFKSKLTGIVEVDETYIGGKTPREKYSYGMNKGKMPVVGMAERGGDIHCSVVWDVKGRTVAPLVRQHVEIGSTLYTDEFGIYPRIAGKLYKHETVCHSMKEYVRDDVHTNTLENFWSHLKRGIRGIYIQVSPKHLNKYCQEYRFRFNTRKLTDSQRFCCWFDWCAGRLTYKTLIA